VAIDSIYYRATNAAAADDDDDDLHDTSRDEAVKRSQARHAGVMRGDWQAAAVERTVNYTLHQSSDLQWRHARHPNIGIMIRLHIEVIQRPVLTLYITTTIFENPEFHSWLLSHVRNIARNRPSFYWSSNALFICRSDMMFKNTHSLKELTCKIVPIICY